jgi:hypothetical protein
MLALSCGTSAQAQRPNGNNAQKKPPQRQADEKIDFERARGLLQKRKRGEKLSADEEAFLERAMAARRAAQRGGQRNGSNRATAGGREQVGFKPLTEMTADDRYQGEDGGLYGQGRNTPPEEHAAAAATASQQIQPLDAEGRPSKDGRVVLLSISMSNATQEFSTFKRIADADPARSPQLTIVDGAQGGQAMAEWVSPDGPPWKIAAERLAKAGVTPAQVQAAWIKLANKSPRGELAEHGKKLEQDTLAVIQNAKAKFPNLQIAYLSSRIYGGYANGALNPEPYAYESGFVVRWLIEDQMKHDRALNYDASQGVVKAPVLVWGPYLWADGTKPRQSDGLVWKREDLSGDGVHPSQSGREKVAKMLLEFFKSDSTARPWFVK